jgi:hypothetical protein
MRRLAMTDELKNAALMYALGADNLEEIVQLGGIQTGTTAAVMRSVIERIQSNMQARPKPRWGFIVDECGPLKVYTPKWEIRASIHHGSITSRATGEIAKDW